MQLYSVYTVSYLLLVSVEERWAWGPTIFDVEANGKKGLTIDGNM